MTKIKEKKEVTIVEKPNEVDTFIAQAIASNLPVETMEKLFALRERIGAEQAKNAFVQAMTDFQSECPTIEKKKKVMGYDGNVRYMYAPLDTIVSQVKGILGKAGLSYTITANVDGENVSATCKITHRLGHSEVSSFTCPIQDTKNKSGQSVMTKPQQYASALTFAKRYAFCNALGILTGDEDTDATDVNKQPEAKSLKSKIIFLLKALGTDTETKDTIAHAVKELTQLELTEKNFVEIVGRLEILVQEQNENN